jgi:DNA helicase HerA-like ATPase
MRKVLELESAGAECFFGEPSFEIRDWMRKDIEEKGYINVIRLMDMIMKPKLFSSFMLSCLTELYTTLEEVGDTAEPRLVFVIDEAHFLFENANVGTLEQIEMILKLIRSKGVSILFCTQNPEDIPASILSQLGLKIQHALRAFTENDRDAINAMVKNFPMTEYYDLKNDITNL